MTVDEWFPDFTHEILVLVFTKPSFPPHFFIHINATLITRIYNIATRCEDVVSLLK
jgi:hypothetical protein